MGFRVVLSSAVALAAIPASAFAVDYATAEQAERLIFPDATAFDARAVSLDAAQLKQLADQGVRGRSADWRATVARQGDNVLGYVVFDDVVGKTELISYAVGIGVDGTVKQIEILAYRESHGSEIRLPAWRRQFVGKGPSAPLRVGEDIANISGATLSCTHVAEGVRRIVAVVALARQQKSLPA